MIGRWFALPAIFLGLLILYYPALGGGAFSDDFAYVFGNQTLQNASLGSLLTGPTNRYEHLPLRDLTYWIDWQLFGANPVPYKLHNLGWYFLGCFAAGFASRQLALLFACSQQLAGRLALATVLLFAFHPLHVESVAWIAGRKELVSGAFTLLATGLFAKGLRENRATCLWGAVLAFAAAMAGKSTVIAFPLVALALALAAPALATTPRRLAPVAAMVGIALSAYLYAKGVGTTFNVSPDMLGEGRGSVGFALQVLGLAFWKSIAPFDLRLIYDNLHPGPALVYLALGSAVVALGSVFVWRCWRTRSLEVFCVLWFAAFMLPFLQLAPFRTWSPFSDRFAYLPVFAIALGIASLLARLTPRAALGGFASILLAFLALSAIRAYDWRSLEALVSRNAERSAKSSAAQAMLVDLVLLPAGRHEEAAAVAGRMENSDKRELLLTQIRYAQLEATAPRESRQDFLRGVYVTRRAAFATASTPALLWYSKSFLASGLFAESEEILQLLLTRPDASQSARMRFNLGLALKGQNRAFEARQQFERAVAEAGKDDELRLKAMQAAAGLTGPGR